jgi:endonuclease/exonuclease/phosphatase family metal-dependent hydrolase
LNIPRSEAANTDLRVLSWNTFVGGVSQDTLRRMLHEHDVDVVALQEVIREPVRDDAELLARYPYHLLGDDNTAPGMAILSRFPILESGVPDLPDEAWDMPRIVWVRLDIGGGQTALVVNAHPIPPRTFLTDDCRLRCYNRGPRDSQISALRAFVEPLRVSGEPLLVVGDFNVTEREEAYLDLSSGFTDVQRAVGLGMGATWRPGRYTLGIPVLRIDYMFTNTRVEPLNYALDCRKHGSDHCAQIGDFRVR